MLSFPPQRFRKFKFKNVKKHRAPLLTLKNEKIKLFFKRELSHKRVLTQFFLRENIAGFYSNTKLKKEGSLIANIFYKFFFATSSNTFSILKKKNLVLPSGVVLLFLPVLFYSAFQSNLMAELSKKSSKFFYKKKKLYVRGVAKNANDHPHGGSGRGGVLRGY